MPTTLTEKMPTTAMPRMMSSVTSRSAGAGAPAISGSGGDRGRRAALSERLHFPPREASPQPFERTVSEAVEPRLRPGEHHQPHRRDHQPQLNPADAPEPAEPPAVEQSGHQDRRAEIIAE